MKKIVVLIVVVLGIVLGLFFSCKNDLIETLEKVQAHVEISVKLPEEMISVYSFDPDSFGFTFSWYPSDDEEEITSEEFVYQDNFAIVYKFDPGEYTFEVIAVQGSELKASGSITTSISPGQRGELEIPLAYYVFGADKAGFILDKGVMRLSDDMTFNDGDVITVPAGKRLVIDDGRKISVSGNGTLTIKGDVEAVGELKIAEELVIEGTLNSKTITGEGTLKADSVHTDKISNTGDLIIDAHPITATEIELKDDKTLTLTGNVTTESISGDGNLDVERIVGACLWR